VGTFIWETIDGSRDGTAVVEALVQRFEVDRDRAALDYLGFVAKLLSLHALQEVREGEADA
jgi:hypothetical protein